MKASAANGSAHSGQHLWIRSVGKLSVARIFAPPRLWVPRSTHDASPETREARFWASSVSVAVVVFVAFQMSDVCFMMVVRERCSSCFVRIQGSPLVFAKSFGFSCRGNYSPRWFLKMFLCVCQFDQFFTLCSVATRVRVVERGPYDNVGFRR